MLAWMFYVIVVSLLLGLAALALERAAQIRRVPTRWLWAASMVASLLVPLVMSLVPVQIPRRSEQVEPAIPEQVAALRQTFADGLSPSGWLTAAGGRFAALPDLDRPLQVGWTAASTILLAAILASGAQLTRRRRGWKPGNMAGVPVYLSQDTGPAIAGLVHPYIVIPRWLMQCPPDVQELVIAHERLHLEAHDGWLVMIALGLLVCTPWNLPLWWQLRRLRLAVEIDCDSRVLRLGYGVARYGETLIAVAERRSATLAMVAAMVESRTLLELRIRNMVRTGTRYSGAMAVALACLGVACVAGAAELSSPTKDDPVTSPAQDNAVDGKILDGHVGFYQLNDYAVLTITRDGQSLSAQLAHQRAYPLHALSRTEFSYRDGRIIFITESDGQTTSLILRKYGVDMPMKRIDAAAAQRIASAIPEPPAGRLRLEERGGALIMGGAELQPSPRDPN